MLANIDVKWDATVHETGKDQWETEWEKIKEILIKVSLPIHKCIRLYRLLQRELESNNWFTRWSPMDNSIIFYFGSYPDNENLELLNSAEFGISACIIQEDTIVIKVKHSFEDYYYNFFNSAREVMLDTDGYIHIR